jgi:nucleoside-diphosphate kinase
MQFLAVLKPDGVIRKAAGAGILKGILDTGLCKLNSFKQVMVTEQLLAVHYAHVSTRSFYPWLVRYMSAYPSYVILLETEGENIETIRRVLGATRAHEAAPDSLRSRFCPYGGANGLHLSEDEKAGEYETNLWKQTLGIEAGQFDVPIQAYVDRYLDKPNHTLELRSLLTDIASKKAIDPQQAASIKAYLRAESLDAPADQIDFLDWVLTDPLLQ